MKVLVTDNVSKARDYTSHINCNAIAFSEEIDVFKVSAFVGRRATFDSTFEPSYNKNIDDPNPCKYLFPLSNRVNNINYNDYDILLLIRSCRDWAVYIRI